MRSVTIGTNEMAQTRKVRKGESMRLFDTTGLRRKITGLLKGTLILTACLSMSAGMFPAGASAAETIDLTRRGSLSITFTSNGEPISDGNEVGIYRVADIVVDNGYKFVPTGDFASVGNLPTTSAELDQENRDLAEKMERIIKSQGLPLYESSQKLDENGTVVFKDLEPGLYLVAHTKVVEITKKDKTREKYTLNPFLVSIPQNDNGKLIYDVTTKPKASPYKEMVPPDKPRRIPQTGQLWWPAIALGAAGTVFVVLGLLRKARS